MKDKTFNWCEKCRRWTVTHTTATHTGSERRPGSSPPAPSANLSMLTPDPSVWLFDFPVDTAFKPTKSISLLDTVKNFIGRINIWLLLAMSILVCAILPSMVNLAIYLTSTIPW